MPIVSGGGGGGGGQPAHGCVATLSGDQTPASGDVVLFDTTTFDTDAILNPSNHRFIIPAGLGGVWAFGAVLMTTIDPGTLTYAQGLANVFGDPDNVHFNFARAATAWWVGTVYAIGKFQAGQYFRWEIFLGGTGLILSSGSNQTLAFATFLGT